MAGRGLASGGGLFEGGNLPGCDRMGTGCGAGEEDAAGECDGVIDRASAYPAASGTAHRPMTTTLTTVPAPLDREVTTVSHRVLERDGWSCAYLRETNRGATRVDFKLDLVDEARHQCESSAVIGVHRAIHHGHHERPVVSN